MSQKKKPQMIILENPNWKYSHSLFPQHSHTHRNSYIKRLKKKQHSEELTNTNKREMAGDVLRYTNWRDI